jgi:cell division protein FtsI/penicillin-binding protein 2
MLGLAAAAIALGFRLFQIQIIDHTPNEAHAQDVYWTINEIIGPRGTITDRNGHPLAMEEPVFDLKLRDSQAFDEQQISSTARSLASALDMEEDEILDLWLNNEGMVRLKTGLPYADGKKLEKLHLPTVDLVNRGNRFYPEGNMAAESLGIVGLDGIGLSGIESSYNREVGGVPGKHFCETDGFGICIPTGYNETIPAKPGGRLILTIDRVVQHIAEQELDAAIDRHNASGGTIIVMDPHTGEILAMTSRPSFNISELTPDNIPNNDIFTNPAIEKLFEPGSTFKLITMAAALNEGLVTPQTTFNDSGPVRRYGTTLDNWNGVHHDIETMTQVLQHSCNVGAVWVSDLLGPDLFYKYVDAFGFGTLTHIDLDGEEEGLLRHPGEQAWSPIDLNTNSYGQGISVTPIQLITAVSAIANGGSLMRPYVVREIEGGEDPMVFEPVVVRRVISNETSNALTGMMNVAAEKGESKLAIVPGYHIAGKTGTASIPTLGGYVSDGTIASFVGFGPVDEPRFVILVKIDWPKDKPWGSLVASPVFSSIASQLFAYYGIEPTEPITTPEQPTTP